MQQLSKSFHSVNSLKALVLSLLISAAGSVAMAQTPPPRADAPELKVGDRWKTEVRDRRTKVKESERERSVTAISATQIEGIENGEKYIATPELSTIESSTAVVTAGELKSLNFPLEIGKKWDYKYNMKNKVNGTPSRWQFDASVVAFEKVKVPAGEFDAYKIQAKGFWKNETSGYSGRAQLTEWYAPSARTVVKTEFDDGFNYTVRELIELQLQP